MSGSALRRRSGFSLIELLVVISIVAVLLSVVLPSLSAARETAQDALCKARQRQLGVAGASYFNEYRVYLPSFQSQTDDPQINTAGDVRSPARYGSSAVGLLHEAGYITIPLGLYSSSASSSRSAILEGARKATVSLCPSGRYYGPPQAPGAMAYIIFPGDASGLDDITRTQDGYDTSRAGTTIIANAYESQTSYIQSYAVNSRFSTAITVPGGTPRTGYTAVRRITGNYSESSLLVWAEFFQRDGLDHGYRISMSTFLGTSSEYSMPRWAYYRTPHGAKRSGNWAALDGHVGTVTVAQLQAAWNAGNATAAAPLLPWEF